MKNETGTDKPGISSKNTPHLGNLLLERYENRITEGFIDLENFELVDRLEKPALNFIFYGSKKEIIT